MRLYLFPKKNKKHDCQFFIFVLSVLCFAKDLHTTSNTDTTNQTSADG